MELPVKAKTSYTLIWLTLVHLLVHSSHLNAAGCLSHLPRAPVSRTQNNYNMNNLHLAVGQNCSKVHAVTLLYITWIKLQTIRGKFLNWRAWGLTEPKSSSSRIFIYCRIFFPHPPQKLKLFTLCCFMHTWLTWVQSLDDYSRWS